MLFILTGQVQIGKTRWLERCTSDLARRGVGVFGMLSPGDWHLRPNGEVGGEKERGRSGAGRYEKRGIDCVLLPGGERFPFARRADLARSDGSFDAASQSARARLGWAIDDAALVRANAHFSYLADALSAQRAGAARGGLLVVDELGRLELERGEGLSSALSLVERGATPLWEHALVVVRAQLADRARALLASAWPDGVLLVSPDDAGRAAIEDAAGASHGGEHAEPPADAGSGAFGEASLDARVRSV